MASRSFTMTPLRQRMIEDMTLRGFSARTQQSYVAGVARLAKHCGKSPEQISEEELRACERRAIALLA